MPNSETLRIAAEFANALSALTEDQLIVVMDDYKACATIAAIHRDDGAGIWLQERVDAITEEYGRRMLTLPLPF